MFRHLERRQDVAQWWCEPLAMSFASRASIAALAVACLVPATAFAGPTIGFAIGKSETETDANKGDDANTSLGVFARVRLCRIVWLQGEFGKLDTDASTNQENPHHERRRDLQSDYPRCARAVRARRRRARPRLEQHSHLGLPARRGRRWCRVPLACASSLASTPGSGDRNTPSQVTLFEAGVAKFAPAIVSSQLAPGQYRSVRLTLGVHF